MTTFLIVAAALIVLFFAAAYGTYRFIFYSPNKTQNNDHTIPVSTGMEEQTEHIHRMIDQLAAVPYEEVKITSHDGLRLRGRYYHQRDGAPLAICFHGYRGTPTRDFSGGSRVLAKLGYNLLLVEERAHCASEGHTISFGVNERKDCLAWVFHFHYRFPETEMLLVGVSMGAATVLMASALPLPDCVKGIIADCPFTEPLEIIKKTGQSFHIPPFVTAVMAPVAARLFGRFNLKGASALKAIREAKVPILLIHGEDDTFVPCTMSFQLHANAPELSELHTFPGANHGVSYVRSARSRAPYVSEPSAHAGEGPRRAVSALRRARRI